MRLIKRAIRKITRRLGYDIVTYIPVAPLPKIPTYAERRNQLALYLLGWDQYGGGSSEQVQIVNAATGQVLDTQSVSNYGNGKYLICSQGDLVFPQQIVPFNGFPKLSQYLHLRIGKPGEVGSVAIDGF
jgi:hypothetical protein